MLLHTASVGSINWLAASDNMWLSLAQFSKGPNSAVNISSCPVPAPSTPNKPLEVGNTGNQLPCTQSSVNSSTQTNSQSSGVVRQAGKHVFFNVCVCVCGEDEKDRDCWVFNNQLGPLVNINLMLFDIYYKFSTRSLCWETSCLYYWYPVTEVFSTIPGLLGKAIDRVNILWWMWGECRSFWWSH